MFDDTQPNSARPYICEIGKTNLYKIVNYDRGFGKIMCIYCCWEISSTNSILK